MAVFEATEIHVDWEPDGGIQYYEIGRGKRKARHALAVPSMILTLMDDDGNVMVFRGTRDAFTHIAAAIRETKCND